MFLMVISLVLIVLTIRLAYLLTLGAGGNMGFGMVRSIICITLGVLISGILLNTPPDAQLKAWFFAITILVIVENIRLSLHTPK